MAALLQDLRYGFRLLHRHRGFTAVAVLVLAFGIGANTAVFTIVNALVLKPRPGAPDHELAGVYSRDRTQADSYRAFSYPNYADLRDRKLFASVAAHSFSLLGLTEGEVTRRVFVDVITANYFDTFGVPLVRGRTFSFEEERPGANIPVAILSHAMWQRLGGTEAGARHGGHPQRPEVHGGRRRRPRLRRFDGDVHAGAVRADRCLRHHHQRFHPRRSAGDARRPAPSLADPHRAAENG